MQFLRVTTFILPLVAALVALVRYRHLMPALRYLAWLVFFTNAMEVASRVAAAVYQNNLFLLPIDTLVEFGLLALMYRQALRPSAVSRALPLVLAGFALASGYSYFSQRGVYEFNSVQRFAESLLVIGLVLLYLFKLLRELVVVQLEREPLFWVSGGLLLYFAGNVFIFVSSNYVIEHSRALSIRLWDIHQLLYIVLYSLYAWALWMKPSTPK